MSFMFELFCKIASRYPYPYPYPYTGSRLELLVQVPSVARTATAALQSKSSMSTRRSLGIRNVQEQDIQAEKLALNTSFTCFYYDLLSNPEQSIYFLWHSTFNTLVSSYTSSNIPTLSLPAWMHPQWYYRMLGKDGHASLPCLFPNVWRCYYAQVS